MIYREDIEHLKKTDPKAYAKAMNQRLRELGRMPTIEDFPSKRPSIDEIFKKYLPDTMYYSHYQLAELYGYTPQEWRTYLRDNALFIETELAAIAEAEARSALSRLGNASGQEVTALKAILEKSKLINDSQKQQTKVLMTFIPPSKPQKEDSHDTILRESAQTLHRHSERTDY